MIESGIYKITNLINGKTYVGSAVDIKSRWRSHTSTLKLNKHRNTHLQRSWNKYGECNFKFEILENCEKEKLIEREQYYIDSFNVYKKGYNRDPVAGSKLGTKHTEETKKKISITKIEQHLTLSDNAKRAIGKLSKGNTYALGYKHTEEEKKKIGEVSKGNTHNVGRKHSEESKKKISESNKGKYKESPTEESKKKMSEAHKGKRFPFGYKTKEKQ